MLFLGELSQTQRSKDTPQNRYARTNRYTGAPRYTGAHSPSNKASTKIHRRGKMQEHRRFCYGWTATYRALLLPGRVGSIWHCLLGLCLCYLARGRRHLAFGHSSLGHLSFQFVHMGSAVSSCGQHKTRSVGLLTPDGPSHQSLAWAATAGS